ncbi:MAG: SDR family oxidoreductase [Actinobacteria bacterium]|nr:SDR family oxidoreductase [Actinomycetota bacterium]
MEGASEQSVYSLPGLSGKVALVTGGGSGIGAASALCLGASGARTIVVGRNRERLEASVAAIRAAGGEADLLVCDVDEDGAAALLVEEAVALAGRIDVLLLSAGRYEAEPLEEAGVGSLDRQYRTNVRAPYELIAAALPQLRDGGAVVVISSIVAFAGFPGSAAYCASKGAVDALVRALAGELGPQGVRVNAIAPGETETLMNQAYYAEDPDYLPRMAAVTPAGRAAKPADIGPVAAFLASDAAGWVHGETVVVDGGLTASIPGSIPQ